MLPIGQEESVSDYLVEQEARDLPIPWARSREMATRTLRITFSRLVVEYGRPRHSFLSVYMIHSRLLSQAVWLAGIVIKSHA
jgi:hypothetical protein